MPRQTVEMPSETNIRSMELLPLQALSLDCEINPDGIPRDVLVDYLLTLRALFDGRHFSIPRDKLVALAKLVAPSDIDTGFSVGSDYIALQIALLFQPVIR